MASTDYVALPNPLWSCQLQILGGQRRLGVVIMVYGGILVGLLVLFRMPFRELSIVAFAHEALKYLAFWQCVMVTLGGCAAISKALFRDQQTRMIEAHRTSPMSGMTVAIGYVIGPNLQILCLLGVGALVGVVLVWFARDDMQNWILAHIYLVIVELSIWSAAVFFGLGAVNKRSQFPTLLGIAAATIAAWLSVVPAFAILSGIASVLWCYGMLREFPGVARGSAVVIGLAVAVTAYWLGAAARRYRHPYLSPLSPMTAAVGATIWVIVTLIILQVGDPSIGSFSRLFDPETVTICLPLSVLCLAPVPFAMAAIARRQAIESQLGTRAESAVRCWRWSFVGVAVFALAIGGMSLLSLVNTRVAAHVAGLDATAWSCIMLSGALAILTACGLLEAALLLTGKFLLGIVGLVLMWTLPPMVDLVHAGIVDTAGPEIGSLASVSPGGLMVIELNQSQAGVLLGLIIQGGMAICALFAAGAAADALRRRTHR